MGMFCIRTILWLLAISQFSLASEFPERECCDLTTTEATSTTSIQGQQLFTSASSGTGSNTKTTVAILNCITARQLCFNDSSCSSILEIIPRVCGPEVVACSTVTVTKCQAALRTLQAFPFFKPTCLCREPHMDPECNSFRDFLFDHPCMFVKEKEKDPYPVDTLPTCTHAHYVCQQETKCIKLYEDFKTHCKVRENKCRMEDRDLCFEAWAGLRRSPMFGCICPNNHMKKRCDRMFSIVNHNPCVALEYTMTTYPTEDLDGGYAVPFKNALIVDRTNGQDAHADHNHIYNKILKNDRILKDHRHHYIYPDEEDTQHINQSSSNHHHHHHLHHNNNNNNNNNNYNIDNHQQQPQHHSSYSSNVIEPEKDKLLFYSTCHEAMDSCNTNYHCKRLLDPILLHCDITRCNRNACMEALQTFYTKPDFPWNVEIAFCLCKKTENRHDACLVAQEKLHPVCAQRNEESTQPTCLHLAEACKENEFCRSKLEYYGQACAVDSVTKKCAGPLAECRKSILAILGTDLRTICACKGTDMGQLYKCLGWQRLLWVNPCVVEAQKHYHMRKAAEHIKSLPPTTTTSTTVAPITTRTTTPTTTTTTTTTRTTTTTTSTILSPSGHLIAGKSITEAAIKGNTMTEFLPPPQAFVPTSTTRKSTTTKRTRATTTTTTTTAPPRSCIVQRPQFPDQFIKEGSFKRIYHEDEFECSDICECEIGEKLSCRTICIDRMPCKTEFAFYNHAAPAYQAYRGRCLCYSGRFICMKPSPMDYSLPHGIFLFLGYSQVDERELNKNHTTHLVVIQDVVRVLQNFIKVEADKENGTLCNLEFYNSTKENVIIIGKLSDETDTSKMTPIEILTKEKDECAELLEVISDRINSRHPEFLSHVLLSVFKMAEVEIVPIETSSATRCNHMLLHNNSSIIIIIIKMVFFHLTVVNFRKLIYYMTIS